jgi:hypothetical protein
LLVSRRSGRTVLTTFGSSLGGPLNRLDVRSVDFLGLSLTSKGWEPGQWEIANSWSSRLNIASLNIASLNFSGRRGERVRDGAVEHGDAEEKSGKLHGDGKDC